MRLVIKYDVGDGCTWHCEVVRPVEYYSAEQLYVDFETLARHEYEKRWPDRKVFVLGKHRNVFVLGKHTFDSADFFLEDGTYNPPEILTVDEWFLQA